MKIIIDEREHELYLIAVDISFIYEYLRTKYEIFKEVFCEL